MRRVNKRLLIRKSIHSQRFSSLVRGVLQPTIFIFIFFLLLLFHSFAPTFFFTLLCSDVNRDVAFGYSPRYSGTSFYKEWPTPSYSKLFRERVETQRSKTWTYFNSRSIFFFMNKWIVSCIVQELNFYKNKKVVELYKTEGTYVKLRNRKTDNYTIYIIERNLEEIWIKLSLLFSSPYFNFQTCHWSFVAIIGFRCFYNYCFYRIMFRLKHCDFIFAIPYTFAFLHTCCIEI